MFTYLSPVKRLVKITLNEEILNDVIYQEHRKDLNCFVIPDKHKTSEVG